jgi:hypothetical protein
MGLGNVLFGR